MTLAGGAAIADTGAVLLADIAGVTLDLNGANETIGSLAGGGATGGIVTNGVAGTSTLTTGDATNTTFSGVIQDGAGTVALTKQGSGIFTLSGTNTYTGVTTINAGTLSVATIGDGGVAGNLGAATNAAANLVLAGGTLQYTGAAASTDRLFTLTSNGGTIDASGAGALDFTNTGSVAFSGSGARTLTLAGTNTGNNTLAAVLGDGAGGPRSMLVNTVFCGMPLGASAGGFLASWLIPAYGWRAVLIVGGLTPLILSVFLVLLLPESVRFLVARKRPVEKIRKILRRIFNVAFKNVTTFTSSETQLPTRNPRSVSYFQNPTGWVRACCGLPTSSDC